MDPVLTCDDLPMRVPAGAETRVPFTIRNTGDEIDHFRFEVLGAAERWARVEPRQVAGVEPGDRATVDLVLRPPQGTPNGSVLVGVRALSLVDPDLVAVAEGEVRVGSADQVDVVAAAVAGSGRHSGRYVIQVGNAGTSTAQVQLTPADLRQELGFAVAPREVSVAPGDFERAYLTARPRRPRLTGRPVRHRFTVEHRLPSGTRDRLDLEFEQRPVLGPAATMGATLLAVAVAAGAALLLWPTVRSLLTGEEATPTAPTASSAEPTATGDPVQGAFVLWEFRFVDDAAQKGALEETRDLLEAAGVEAEIVNSADSDRLSDEPAVQEVLLTDGFTTEEEAQAACENQEVVPDCSAFGPD